MSQQVHKTTGAQAYEPTGNTKFDKKGKLLVQLVNPFTKTTVWHKLGDKEESQLRRQKQQQPMKGQVEFQQPIMSLQQAAQAPWAQKMAPVQIPASLQTPAAITAAVSAQKKAIRARSASACAALDEAACRAKAECGYAKGAKKQFCHLNAPSRKGVKLGPRVHKPISVEQAHKAFDAFYADNTFHRGAHKGEPRYKRPDIAKHYREEHSHGAAVSDDEFRHSPLRYSFTGFNAEKPKRKMVSPKALAVREALAAYAKANKKHVPAGYKYYQDTHAFQPKRA